MWVCFPVSPLPGLPEALQRAAQHRQDRAPTGEAAVDPVSLIPEPGVPKNPRTSKGG